MKYACGLEKKEREIIFKLFLENAKLRFNAIEKALKIRSNMVSYHLERMQHEGLVNKEGEYYCLTRKAETYLPIIQHVVGEELSPLPVVLVALMNKDEILLIKRNRRPYKNYWGLIGGKMLLEESFKETGVRLVKEKSSLNAKFVSINSILHERVKGDSVIKHCFILFFTKMIVKETNFKESMHGRLKWFKIKDIGKEKIIPSDLWLIKNNLNSRTDIKNAYITEDEGELSSFRIFK